MRWLAGWAWRVGGAMGVMWLVGVALLTPSAPPPNNGQDTRLAQRLQRAVHELDTLKKQNDDIRIVLRDFTKQMSAMKTGDAQFNIDMDKDGAVVAELQAKLEHAQRMLQQVDSNTGDHHTGSNDFTPSLEFESTRRLVEHGVQETWWYISDQLKQLKKKVESFTEYSNHIDQILNEGANHVRVTQHDLKLLSELDGLGSWREREANDLSDVVQKRLHALQHPPDCSKAKKLVCNLNKGCGYGCQIHHVVYCFIVAYGTRRTLILKSRGWRYNKAGWEDVFLPLSETCTDASGASYAHWPGTEDTQVIDLPIIDTLPFYRPPYLPLAIPKDLSERMMRLHGNPSSWWIGQFLKYMLKPQPKTQEMLQSMSESLNFQKPIVGVHVRRTDKVGTEAAFHSIEEYMKHVDDYYQAYEITHPNTVRRVYLASDDPTVINDARKKYPEYIFIGDPSIARSAAVATRYTDTSLKGIIADIHFLANTDFLVCTFSSQVCRIAFEIMQTLYPDASGYYKSLDDIYYYGGQNAHYQRARFNHTPHNRDEISLKKGDLVGVHGNHWNGFSKGSNKRNHQVGLYPSYKMEEVVDIAPCPSYEDVDKKGGT